MSERKIAFVGMGQMGSAMAQRLIESGYDVLGFDIDPRTRNRLSQEGVPVAEDLAAALKGRTAVLSSLPNPEAARKAFLEPDGVVACAEPSSLLMDLSTIDPNTMKDIGAAAEAKGHLVLDCPVSGSPTEARSGDLILMVGGKQDVVSGAEPLIEKLGKSWRHTGDVGTAKVVKIVNNMMSMGNILVAAEAFALGSAAGVDRQTLFDIISISGGRSHHFTKRFPNALKGNYEPGFKMELGEKDLALGIEFARSLNAPTPVASVVRGMFDVALCEGYRGKDVVALLAMYDEWAAAKQSNPGGKDPSRS